MRRLAIHQRLYIDRIFATITGFSNARVLFVVFAVGFFIRLVPELLAGAAPIGFDTVYYAAAMKSGVVWANWSSFFTSAWLLQSLNAPLYSVLQVEPFLLLKVVAPALYGLNVVGVYFLGRRLLSWDVKMCLATAGLFAIQLAAIRISWDLLRNTLGMGLLLFALSFVYKLESKRDFLFFTCLSLLTVFAHQYSGVTIVVIVLGVLGWRFIRKSFKRNEVLTFLAFLPALIVFVVGMLLRFFPVEHAISTNAFSTAEGYVGRSGFFVNYLAVSDMVYHYPTYADLLADVMLLFLFLYLSYLFLVWKGFFRNGVLTAWTVLLLAGSFGCLVWPFFALDLWSRWMFMLVYPFTFYAVNGLFRLLRSKRVGKDKNNGVGKKTIFGALCATLVLGSIYVSTPFLMNQDQGGVFVLPYVSAHFSSAPAVPYHDVKSVSEAWTWLDENMITNSCVLVNHVFVGWEQLYLGKNHATLQFLKDGDLALDDALDRGFNYVYLVWWNTDIGWYNVSVPDRFLRLRDFGRISVYDFRSG